MANLVTLASIGMAGSWLLGEPEEEDPIVGSRMDQDGNFLERNADTSGRMNMSAIARRTRIGMLIGNALRMAGIPINDDFTNSRGDDYWLYYRNITWLPEALLGGRIVKGDMKRFLDDLTPYLGDMAGMGILWQLLGIAKLGSIDAKKEPLNYMAEGWFELLSAPVNPSALTRYIGYLADPVSRRTKDNETIGFDMNPVTSIMHKVPGATKELPAAGDIVKASFAGFDAEEYRRTEMSRIQNNQNWTTERKQQELAKLEQRVRTRSVTPVATQKAASDLFQSFGLDPRQFDSNATSSRNVLADLSALKSMGVGPESVIVRDNVTKTGRIRKEIVYPDPATVAVRDPFWSAFKVIAGPNIRTIPSPARRRETSIEPPQPPMAKALTADDMFAKRN